MERFKKVIVFTGSGIITPLIAGDCVNALLRAGVGAMMMEVLYDSGKGPGSAAGYLEKGLRSATPDLILSIDCGIVREFPELFASLGIPVAAWFVDDPMRIMSANNIFDNLYVFTWDRFFAEPLKQLGCGFVEYLPLGTDPSVFRRLLPESTECSPYSCAVSFVGSSLAEFSMERAAGGLNSAAKEALGKCVEQHARMPHPPVVALLADMEKSCGINIDAKDRYALEIAIEGEAMKLFRSGAVNALAGLSPRVYGDEGWNGMLAGGAEFMGRIDYAKDLNKLYSASKINLNVSKSQLRTAVNQRVFDVPACGGFVLTDYREDAERLFDPEKEIAVFKSLDEMKAMAEYFLENEEERAARARAARRRVLSEHTYIHRMKSMLEMLAEVV